MIIGWIFSSSNFCDKVFLNKLLIIIGKIRQNFIATSQEPIIQNVKNVITGRIHFYLVKIASKGAEAAHYHTISAQYPD